MEIELDDLSAGARGAVHRLDLRALEECHLILEKSQALDGAPADLLVTPRKIPVFIAYRRTQVETAKRLHGILQGIGRGTIFDPYLDLHDMQSGTWKDQLFERIESTGLFMPLVSDDYGEVDSVSREEYEYAKGVAADREGASLFRSHRNRRHRDGNQEGVAQVRCPCRGERRGGRA